MQKTRRTFGAVGIAVALTFSSTACNWGAADDAVRTGGQIGKKVGGGVGTGGLGCTASDTCRSKFPG